MFKTGKWSYPIAKTSENIMWQLIRSVLLLEACTESVLHHLDVFFIVNNEKFQTKQEYLKPVYD